MNVGDLFDELKSSFVRFFNDKEQTVNEIRNDVSQIKAGTTAVQSELANLKNNLDERFNGVDGKIFTIEKNLDGKIDGVNNNVSSFGDRFNRLDSSVGEILAICRSERADLISQLSAAKDTVISQRDKINRPEGELKSANENLSSQTSALDYTRAELTRTQNELSRAQKNSADAQKSLQALTQVLEIYAPVRTAMKNCATFRSLLEERALSDDSQAGLFAFAQEIGKTTDFVSAVHKAALDERSRQNLNPPVMTCEEIAVYDALNRCCRQVWKIDFDIFTTPGSRASIVEPFEKTFFNRVEAVYFKDARNTGLKYTQGIYVPLLLNREGRVLRQAYAAAGNL